MIWSRLTLVFALVVALLAAPGVTFAQESGDSKAATKSDDKSDGDGEDEETLAEDEAEDDGDEEEEKESEDGSYGWKRSFGGGLEYGLWFSPLNRWESRFFGPEPAAGLVGEINASPLWSLDLAVEASLLEGTRITLFGGMQRPFSGEPKIGSFYLGLEPAFAFRRDMWEIALGIGVGIGSTRFEVETGENMKAGLVLLRPFVEVRRYFGTLFGVYLRGGFNQWLVNNPEFEGIEFAAADTNLDEGAPYFAIGVRFGHYPKHVVSVPDTDGDGFKDDVDECPEEPEDVDQFEDDDGCPEADNDKDGINDDVDKCPLRPEDKDGWQDDDGCPEADDDADGDGILNDVDKCMNDPEDFDKFEDEDGCPDNDNDNDGVMDKDDDCPMKPGVPAKKGCPFELVEVTLDKIVIKDKIFFDLNKATIKSESFGLLDQVAETINAFPRIKLIEIAGHTDHKGKAAYNKTLSENRAKSVYEYLIGKGVDASRLQYKGYGMEKPLIPLGDDGKETKEEAAKNRRVEFNILQQEEVKKTVREDKVEEVKEETPAPDGEAAPQGDAAPEAEAPAPPQ